MIFESIKLRSFPFKALVILTKVLKCYYGPVSRQIWIASYGLYAALGPQTSKSAITHTLAEMWKNHQWLLATSFFWKTAAERSNADRFVVTIAYQIARAIPTLRPIIESGVDTDSMVFHQTIDAQLAELIIKPIQRLHSIGFDFMACPFVIIVDGQDDCRGNEIHCGIVKWLATSNSLG